MLVIILVILVAIAAWVIVIYNGFITLRNRVNEAWADIDVQLKRRYNLIPNLVSTVKGYAGHEKEVFQKVTEARASAMKATTPKEHGQAENMLKDTLKSLFAVAENYPELKANENFAKLQEELADTENKIQAARRFYNGNVRDLNTKVEKFPPNIVAKIFNIKKRQFFEIAEAAAREVPKVSF